MEKDWHKKEITSEEKFADCYFQCIYYLSIFNGISCEEIEWFKIEYNNPYLISTNINKYNLNNDITSDDNFLYNMVCEISCLINEIKEINFENVQNLTYNKILNDW